MQRGSGIRKLVLVENKLGPGKRSYNKFQLSHVIFSVYTPAYRVARRKKMTANIYATG